METMKKLTEERRSKSIQADEDFKKVLSDTPLYEKIIKKQTESDQALLEQKKQILADIRTLHRPIDLNEIREHARKCEEKLKEAQEKKQEEDQKNKFTYNLPFVSETYKKVAEENPRAR